MSVALTSNELADEQASSTTDEPTLLTEYEDNEIQEILTSDTEYNSQDTESSTPSTSDTEDNETVPNPSSNTNSHHFRKIFEGSNISVCAFNCCIMQLATKHSLTYNAIGNILDLFSFMCPKPNLIPNTLYKFKIFLTSIHKNLQKKYFVPTVNNSKVTVVVETNYLVTLLVYP